MAVVPQRRQHGVVQLPRRGGGRSITTRRGHAQDLPQVPPTQYVFNTAVRITCVPFPRNPSTHPFLHIPRSLPIYAPEADIPFKFTKRHASPLPYSTIYILALPLPHPPCKVHGRARQKSRSKKEVACITLAQQCVAHSRSHTARCPARAGTWRPAAGSSGPRSPSPCCRAGTGTAGSTPSCPGVHTPPTGSWDTETR